MAQHDGILDDAPGANFRADLNEFLAAARSRNSGASAPSDPVQGMVYVKTVSSTIQEVYEFDGASWILKYVINPFTHEFRSIDGNRRQWGGTAGGSADALTITTTPAITAYEDGQRFVLYTGAGDNTGAMTLAVDGQAAKSLKINGADPAAGDVPANSLLVAQYRSNIMHVVGGALPRATTARYGNVLLDDEAGFLAGVGGKVPTTAIVKKHARERLQGNRTYYVRTDGSDSNTGRVDSGGGAFLTLQKAWNVLQDLIDVNGWTVTVQVRDGTYTAGLDAACGCTGQDSADGIVFQGNSGTPGNVVISVTSASCFIARHGAAFTVKDMELRTTTAGDCLMAESGASIHFSGVRFGACAARHIEARRGGAVRPIGNYAIVGAADRHLFATLSGVVEVLGAITVTLTGTPAFATAFARASNNGGIYFPNVTFSGGATGVRHQAAINGTIDTEGGGASYFPGNSAGSALTGGQYA